MSQNEFSNLQNNTSSSSDSTKDELKNEHLNLESNMQIDLTKLEFLCKIKIPNDEKLVIIKELQQIQENVISKVLDIKCDLEPMNSVHEINLTLFKDEVTIRNTRDDIFDMCTTKTKNLNKSLGYFNVPKFL